MGKGTGCSCEVGTIFLPSLPGLIGQVGFGQLAINAEDLSNQLATSSNNL